MNPLPVFSHIKNKTFFAFIILALAALATLFSVLFKRYVTFSNYSDPPPVLVYSVCFEYLAFSFIAFLFPWSWKIVKKGMTLRALTVVSVAILFVLGYTFVLAVLEWWESDIVYSLWNGFTFTLFSSGLFTLSIYAIIAVILFQFGVTRDAETNAKYLTEIRVKVKNRTLFVPTAQIDLIEAEGNYLVLHHKDEKQYLIRETLKRLEQQIDPKIFIRVHRKYMVNLNRIASYRTDQNGGYILSVGNGETVRMSKTYIDKLHLIREKGRPG